MDVEALRRQFPVCESWVYFNHAAVSPLATATREAMEALIADVHHNGLKHGAQWAQGLEQLRRRLADLVGAGATEIALLKNTSEGLATVAQGMNWKRGDRVVSFDCEFPANLYPWLALRGRGVEVELLPEQALLDLDRIRRACQGARLLSVSFVQYLSGFRADLEALGAICRETGTLLLVDAIQGLGAFPLNVKECGIHLLAADGHKWLTGPEGAGFLFVDAAVLEQITPPEVGWQSVEDVNDFEAALRCAASGAPLRWRAGAGRLECGTLNTVGLLGLGAAVELLQQVGIGNIAKHLQELGAQLAQGLVERGCQLRWLTEARPHRSGITTFRHPQRSSTEVVAALEAAGIQCASRNGWVRCAPHLYNTPAEVSRLLTALAAL